MKKVLFVAALLVAGASVASAEGYNRVAVSYDHTNYGFNKDLKGEEDGIKGFGLNGFGLNYIHGFGLSESLPMFLEVGGNVNFNFGSKDWGDKVESEGFYVLPQRKFQNINLQVPVNFVYRFDMADGVSIAPYVGLNFKLHLTEKFKTKIDTNIPESALEAAGYSKDDLESDWFSVLSKDDMAKCYDVEKDEADDLTWNRFQMGWHVGVGCNYQKYYLGVQFGTDFIPAYSYSGDGYKPKVNTTNLKVSLGYTF
ncbi:outer membrane beta-barrel protein [uncultured Muribaculum sp.]|uniref:outer membrane beta-barrel protein n=1 Tax=uncultured Muribaculum sp. TaxID=1918613 RepID=UPI0025D26BB0|nr:outer membrane beta-barrel protein [uncultured Muribaculum sp.]